MTVDTRSVAGRRTLRLATLGDLRSEVRAIAASARAGRLERIGNWSPGQAFHHLASWMNYAFDGIPGAPPPFFLRWIGPLIKRRFLGQGMPAGFRLPKVEGGTHGAEEMSLERGERELMTAIERLDRGSPPDRHPIFGRMTKDDWVALHLRHAELHLSFLRPGSAAGDAAS